MSCLQKSRMQLPWGEFHAGGRGGAIVQGECYEEIVGRAVVEGEMSEYHE